MRTVLIAVASLAVVLGGIGVAPVAQAATEFTNKTMSDGLGSNVVNDVYVVGNTVYAGTNFGLSISADGGATFTNRTIADGLGSGVVNGVYVADGRIYAATDYGLSMAAAPLAVSCPNVPTAPMQAYGRDVDGKCVDNAPIWVNWFGIADKQYVAWGASWQQWPNNGTGGYVCQRQPYFNSAGSWSVQ